MGDTVAYKEYLAGLLGGVATVITGHPFDTVKVYVFDLGSANTRKMPAHFNHSFCH